MARWIKQTLSVNDQAEIILEDDGVTIQAPTNEEDSEPPYALFIPKDLSEAQGMSIALRMAAKRVEDIGKGLK